MNISISDVMIHINETLSAEARSSLEEYMRQIDGVVSPRFNPGKDHLLMIAFNPEKPAPQPCCQRHGPQAIPPS